MAGVILLQPPEKQIQFESLSVFLWLHRSGSGEWQVQCDFLHLTVVLNEIDVPNSYGDVFSLINSTIITA